MSLFLKKEVDNAFCATYIISFGVYHVTEEVTVNCSECVKFEPNDTLLHAKNDSEQRQSKYLVPIIYLPYFSTTFWDGKKH